MVRIRFNDNPIEVKVDSGCSEVIIPEKIYKQLAQTTQFIKTKVRLRPYGMKDHLEVLGRAKVRLTAEAGGNTETWCYVIKGFQTEPTELADMDREDDEDRDDDNRVIESDLPDAVTMKVMKDYTNKCDVMAKLKYSKNPRIRT